MSYVAGNFDCIVVGAGHAGCEAALASARMGCKTLCLTLSLDAVALMPCNPSVGGTAKGTLVREIDALGGSMGICADKAMLQTRLLNTRKGPGVHSLRVQVDKLAYQREMKCIMENEPNLFLMEGEVAKILVENGRISGVETSVGAIFNAATVTVCTGVYLGSRVYHGTHNESAGPGGLRAAIHLTKSLDDISIPLKRFKTDTPPRVHRDSVSYEKMERWEGDNPPMAFSYLTDEVRAGDVPCYLTYTNEDTHDIVRNNIDSSPMTLGRNDALGPRYCPSIEEKVLRFKDKKRHQVFVETETLESCEMYLQGLFSGLPQNVQVEMLNTIPGLENAVIMRSAYAISYDCIDSTSLKPSLESKLVSGLFFAGQVNGSSGYEEAASQGIMAGINSAQYIKGADALVLSRSTAYTGVLIDDLITKGTDEPYRMMTSRAEYRLLLRHDNADLRLTELSYKIGLAGEDRFNRMKYKRDVSKEIISKLDAIAIAPSERLSMLLKKNGLRDAKSGVFVRDLLQRPGINYDDLIGMRSEIVELEPIIKEQVEIEMRYGGYIERQKRQVNRLKRMERYVISQDFDYSKLSSLSAEAVEKLRIIRPTTLSQAARVHGVTPSDVSILMIYLEKMEREKQSQQRQN